MDANNVDNSSNHEVMSPGMNLNNCPGYVDPSAMLNYPVSTRRGTFLSSATQMPTKKNPSTSDGSVLMSSAQP